MTQLPSQILAQPTTWELDSIFAGGVDAEPFQHALAQVEQDILALERRLQTLPAVADAPDDWAGVVQTPTDLWERLGTVLSMSGCAYAASTSHEGARVARERATRLYDRLKQVEVTLLAGLDEADDATFDALFARPELEAERPLAQHDRRRRNLRLPRAEAEVAAALTPHALSGWGALYTNLSGRLEAEITLPGEAPSTRSVGQLAGLLGQPDPVVRERAQDAIVRAWTPVLPTCARALENLTGARAALNARRGVDVLADTCGRNRIERATLDAMWAASDAGRDTLVAYLERKASLMGMDRLNYWDMRAPLPGQADTSVAWGDACQWIVEAFSAYDAEMGDFAANAIANRWVEAEARSGKRGGGFCTRAPSVSQSRVFLTWSDNLRSAMTLAHELGHAWHNHVLFGQSSARREITSATAESASTFGEALFRDYLVERATSPEVRLRMLDQMAMAGVTFLMDVRSRFLLELELYEMQATGPLSVDALHAATVRTQQQAFGTDTLARWDHTLWASKLHFYISAFGFYNWPYAFGFLFSSAIYARAMQEGPSFAPQVRRLLGETGYRWTEDVAQDLLGADLTDPEFWRQAAAPTLRAVEAFLAETEGA